MKYLIVLAASLATPAFANHLDPVPIYPDTPAIVAPPVYHMAPPVVVAPVPRCHVVRETQHDDILDTNDYTEREICD